MKEDWREEVAALANRPAPERTKAMTRRLEERKWKREEAKRMKGDDWELGIRKRKRREVKIKDVLLAKRVSLGGRIGARKSEGPL